MIGSVNKRGIFGIWLMALCVTLGLGSTPAQAAKPFGISSGDRVVLVGGTFIEREGLYGCFETLMTAHFSDHDLTFRNIGWSGDEVNGISRAAFDPVNKGYERLIQWVTETKPTVLIVQYGQNESFQGAAGLDSFIQDMNTFLDDVAETKARIVLVSPTLQENLGAPLPDPTKRNEDIRLYAKAIEKLAQERTLHFIDMVALIPVSNEVTKHPLTDNGVHFTEAGYWVAGDALMKGLGYSPARTNQNELQALRTHILEKKRLFFNQWRPQNETYIFGFRKHEQGQYAAEIPEFDPLIIKLEKDIAAARNQLAPVSGKGN